MVFFVFFFFFLWCSFDLSGGCFVLVGVISCEVTQVYGYALLDLR